MGAYWDKVKTLVNELAEVRLPPPVSSPVPVHPPSHYGNQLLSDRDRELGTATGIGSSVRLTYRSLPWHPRFVYEFRGEATLSKPFVGLISACSVVTPTGLARFRLTVPLRTVYRRAA